MKIMSRWLGFAFAFALIVLAVAFLRDSPPMHNDHGTLNDQTVVLRLNSFALSLNPLKMADVESRRVATLLYAGLVNQEQDGKVQPMIASSWKKSGNEWEFTLRPDVTFSNGAPVKPADVVSSLCKSMQPDSPWAWALASIAHHDSADGKIRECTGITAVGENRIKVVESKPVPWFLDAISGPAGWILPKKNTKEKAYGVMPGAGPYKIKEIVPDVKVVLEARHHGAAVTPGFGTVEFRYLPDDAVAASQFVSGKLQVLDLTSPQLINLLTDPVSHKLKYPGSIVEHPWDRVRVVIINEKVLMNKGFNAQQVRGFIDSFSSKVDRTKIAKLSHGIGYPLASPFPPARGVPGASQIRLVDHLIMPKTKLTILTESDPFSDLIAATLPKSVGRVTIGYKDVGKGILINSLLKGKFEMISMIIEATVHSPEFWKAFFTPGDPYSVVGTPIQGLENVDVTTSKGVAEAGKMIAEQGNWVMIMQEKGIQAIAPGISGINYTPSGQTNFASIRR